MTWYVKPPIARYCDWEQLHSRVLQQLTKGEIGEMTWYVKPPIARYCDWEQLHSRVLQQLTLSSDT